MNIIEQIHNGVPILQSDGINAAGGVVHGFSTRLGGVSEGMWASLDLSVNRGDDPDHVRENFRRFLAAAGARGSAIATCSQVHGAQVRNITTADAKSDPYDRSGHEADGLMTAVPGIALVISTADCLPILLYDPRRRVIAALHAGWRGTAAGIATAAVEQMVALYGSDPADILAAIGPGIGPCCFETHEDVPNAMTAAMAMNVLPFIRLKENGKFSVDLRGVNAKRLELAGVDPAHIAVSGDCTCCLSEKYWSHRRQGTQRGSMASMIQLTEGA